MQAIGVSVPRDTRFVEQSLPAVPEPIVAAPPLSDGEIAMRRAASPLWAGVTLRPCRR